MSEPTSPAEKAQRFAALHIPGDPIVLPNAWDAASAYVIAQAGAKAIATSSAACSWSIGEADGNVISRDDAVGVVRRIARAVDVPVTADIETGYGDDEDALADTIRAVLDAGAVGVNLEDSGGDPLYPIDVAAQRISVARRVADNVGIPLYINARTDVYFAPVGEAGERLDLTLRRAEAYLAAGASGIFVPGVRDPDTIALLTAGIGAPVNILAGAQSPSRAELADAGVGRISTGSSLNLAMLMSVRDTVERLLATGSFAELGGIGYPVINAHFAGR